MLMLSVRGVVLVLIKDEFSELAEDRERRSKHQPTTRGDSGCTRYSAGKLLYIGPKAPSPCVIPANDENIFHAKA